MLFLAGTIIPYYELVYFVLENGFQFSILFEQLFATRISRFFAYDVIISAIVLVIFILKGMNYVRFWWLALVATLFIGVSSGLPLFLYLREISKEDYV
jgi:hypothetical protein